MLKVQVFCFLASYIVAFGLELARMLGKSRLHRAVILGFGTAGFVAQTAYLFNRFQETRLPPLLSSMQDWLLVLAWTLVLFYLFITSVRPELAFGVFVLPVVLLFIASTYLMPASTHNTLDARRGLTMLHSMLLVFGMGFLAGGFVAGLMYLVQHSRLKTRHRTRAGWLMPNLEKLAQFNRWSVMLAFPLLTVGFATGILLILKKAGDADRHVSFNDPTVIGSGVLWILLAAVFVRLLTVNAPTGKQVAWLTLCGCGFLILAVLGLQIIAGSHFAQNPAAPGTASVMVIPVEFSARVAVAQRPLKNFLTPEHLSQFAERLGQSPLNHYRRGRGGASDLFDTPPGLSRGFNGLCPSDCSCKICRLLTNPARLAITGRDV